MTTTQETRRPLPGIFARLRTRVPFQERLRMMRAAGFEATAVWWEESNPMGRKLREVAPQMIRDCGLYLDNIHVPYKGCRDFWSPDPTLRSVVIEQHRRWVDDCARHTVPRMVMHVVQGSSAPETPPDAIADFLRLVTHAEKQGVVLALENTRHTVCLDALLAATDSPALGLCYDSSHDWLHSERPFALLERWGHRICTSHFSDTDGVLDRHWLPRSGVIDFDALLEFYPSQAGEVCMLEVTPRSRDEAPEAFFAQAFERCQALAVALR